MKLQTKVGAYFIWNLNSGRGKTMTVIALSIMPITII
jgi:hypothetical protein